MLQSSLSKGKLQRVEKHLVAESSRRGIYRLSSLSQTGCSASCLSDVAETSTWNSGRTWQLRGTGKSPAHTNSCYRADPSTATCAETMGSLNLAITTHLANRAPGSHTGLCSWGPSAFRLMR